MADDPITAPSWSLVSLADAKAHLRVEGDGMDATLAVDCGLATTLLESVCDRPFFINHTWDGKDDEPPIVEGHDLLNRQSSIFVLHRPLRRLISIAVLGSPLTLDSVVTDAESGMIGVKGRNFGFVGLGREPYPVGPFGPNFPEDYYQRLGGGFFPAGNGIVEVQYLGGWAKQEDVPPDVKLMCLDVVARIFRDEERKTQGIITQQTNMGTATKFADGFVSKSWQPVIERYRRLSTTATVRSETGALP